MKGTKADRDTLRERVKAALGDRTQKELDEQLGLSSGTLTRIFGGRRNVDLDLVNRMAAALDLDPHALVKGTGFAELHAAEELPPEAGDEESSAEEEPVVDAVPTTDAPVAEEPPVEVALDDDATVMVPDPTPEPVAARVAEPVPEPPAAADEAPAAAEAEAEEDWATADEPTESRERSEGSEDITEEEPYDPERTLPVPDPIGEEPPKTGLGGRIRRFFSNMFGG